MKDHLMVPHKEGESFVPLQRSLIRGPGNSRRFMAATSVNCRCSHNTLSPPLLLFFINFFSLFSALVNYMPRRATAEAPKAPGHQVNASASTRSEPHSTPPAAQTKNFTKRKMGRSTPNLFRMCRQRRREASGGKWTASNWRERCLFYYQGAAAEG